jgi:hypothetical protein
MPKIQTNNGKMTEIVFAARSQTNIGIFLLDWFFSNIPQGSNNVAQQEIC